MQIMIYGTGAGAHAIAWKCAESRQTEGLFCIPGNAGTQALCDPMPLMAPDNAEFTLFIGQLGIQSAPMIDITVLCDGVQTCVFPPVEIFDGGAMLCVDTTKRFPELEAQCAASMKQRMGLCTFRFDAETGKPLESCESFSDYAACALLPMLKMDLPRLLGGAWNAFDPGFQLPLRDGAAVLLRKDGQRGQKIYGLADLPGEIGVFLDDVDRFGDTLVLSGSHALYVCARHENTHLAQTAAQDALDKIVISD